MRAQFVTNGSLDDQEDNTFRPIGDNFVGFAHSIDLGQVSDTTSNPVVFGIGLAPENDAGCVEYTGNDGNLQDRYDYYLSEMNVTEGVSILSLSILSSFSFVLNNLSLASNFPRRLSKC